MNFLMKAAIVILTGAGLATASVSTSNPALAHEQSWTSQPDSFDVFAEDDTEGVVYVSYKDQKPARVIKAAYNDADNGDENNVCKLKADGIYPYSSSPWADCMESSGDSTVVTVDTKGRRHYHHHQHHHGYSHHHQHHSYCGGRRNSYGGGHHNGRK